MGLRLMLNWLKTWWAAGEPEPVMASAPPQHDLDLVCALYGATYLRSVLSEHGEIQITLVKPDATLSATGLTTAEAVHAVVTKAHKCWGTA